MASEQEIQRGISTLCPFEVPHIFRTRQTIEDIQQTQPEVVNPILVNQFEDLLSGKVSMRQEVGRPWPRKQDMLWKRSSLVALTLALHTELDPETTEAVEQNALDNLTERGGANAVFAAPFVVLPRLKERMWSRFPRVSGLMEFDIKNSLSSRSNKGGQAAMLIANLAIYKHNDTSPLYDYSFPDAGQGSFNDAELNAILGSSIYAD